VMKDHTCIVLYTVCLMMPSVVCFST